ncbi:PREDICTED: GPI transamidase component PIG-S-like isoform X2 [Drosophila arizonae]|uniref:GPI transamidase component PIG-S-like isoform X2 n=1 Tax=Drosophila arizonae TaxID=7263 RepID=A0ABM1Q5K9_DROAR|nr:PREDICTED: GPI transamidase component PIG-S-like isoform X2 [Drosophila arizonae]
MEETSSMKPKRKDTTEDKYRIAATIAFIVVIVGIGVPMWWKTTTVYRVSLPSSAILRLSEHPIKTVVHVSIYTQQPDRAQLLITELQNAFKDSNVWIMEFKQLSPFAKAAEAHTPAALEKLLLQEHPQSVGDFMFIEWPKLEDELLLTTERSALMRTDVTSNKMAQLLHSKILQTYRVNQILSTDERMGIKSEAPQPDYDVVISVLNPKPKITNAKWNVVMAAQTYIEPFLAQISDISSYTVRTQWKYRVALEADLKQVRDQTKLGRHYALQESALPHLLTSIAQNLSASITDKPVINLVVYIPPCSSAPLHIYNNKNQILTRDGVDAFISPPWGGFIIANPPERVCMAYMNDEPAMQYYVNTNDNMQVMLDQLQKLLDISSEVQVSGVKTVDIEQLAPRRWEYESYIRRSAIRHIATASNTLQSLIKLLDQISYIVIDDQVGTAITKSHSDILAAKAALLEHRLLNASALAKRAFVASERGFFDASLLAQLYFPDEQKYAIYIPLFLPVMVPVLSSFNMLRKLLQRKRKEKQP